MTRKEIINHLFAEAKKEFDIEDFIDYNGETSQSFEFITGFEYQDEENGWHEISLLLVGMVYLTSTANEYQNPLNYGLDLDVSSGNYLQDWEMMSLEIMLDGKDISTTEHFTNFGKLLS